MSDRPTPPNAEGEAVLLTGVYGTGKSLLAATIADELERRDLPFAALDLDWLAWYNGGEGGGEHWDAGHPMLVRNLAAVVANYRDAGMRWFVLAGSVASAGEIDDYRTAMGVPIRVVRLTASRDEIERRLVRDGRPADFAVAADWLDARRGEGLEDLAVVNEGPIAETAERVLAWLGWPAGPETGGPGLTAAVPLEVGRWDTVRHARSSDPGGRRLRPRRRPHRLGPAIPLSDDVRRRGGDGDVPRGGGDAGVERQAGRRAAVVGGDRDARARHPEHRERIAAYWDRWTETLGEAIEDAVEVLRELRDQGHVRLYALTNWSGETFPLARPRFPFLEWFDGIVVSGDEKLAKPDERLFRVLLARYELTPERTVYIDDSAANVRVAEDLGMVAVPFIGGVALRATLVALGLLSRAPAPSPAPPAS